MTIKFAIQFLFFSSKWCIIIAAAIFYFVVRLQIFVKLEGHLHMNIMDIGW